MLTFRFFFAILSFIDLIFKNKMKIIKIGGSTIKTSHDLDFNIDYLISHYLDNEQMIIIISAFDKLTQLLKDSIANILAKPKNINNEIETLKLFFNKFNNKNTKILLQIHFIAIENLLYAISILEDCSPKLYDNIIAYGDFISSELFFAEFKLKYHNCEFIDSKKLFITDSKYGKANIDIETTITNLKNLNTTNSIVLAGFIGSDIEGNPTTLGMENSNLSAIICAIAFETKPCVFISDTEAIYQVDPKILDSEIIKNLNYSDALKFAENGLKLLTKEQIELAEKYSIELIYTSFNSKSTKTKINNKVSEYKFIIIFSSNQAIIFSKNYKSLFANILKNDINFIKSEIISNDQKIILYFNSDFDKVSLINKFK